MQTPPKILVIDDEPGVRRYMERALADFYTVLTAADGFQGIAIAQRNQPKLIILDLHLPDIDGLSVLARLKADPHTQNIPVVIASVRGQTDLLFEAQQSGAVDQLIKPFDVQTLCNTVHRNLRFELPEHSPHKTASPPPPRRSAAGLRSTVLVVDDEEGIQKLIQRALEPAYSVVLAGTGQEGLQWARALHPQLILLDIHLPELDGLSVLARLKSEARTADIPVVIVSVQSTTDIMLEGQQAHAADYLIKPFHPDTLRLMVERHIAANR